MAGRRAALRQAAQGPAAVMGSFSVGLEKGGGAGSFVHERGHLVPDAPTGTFPSSPPGALRHPTGELSFNSARELAGMEPQILALEEEIARIEGLFASPDFHRTHATQTNALLAELAAAKEKLPRLYARWEALEALKAAPAK
jgi:hypothetical protein